MGTLKKVLKRFARTVPVIKGISKKGEVDNLDCFFRMLRREVYKITRGIDGAESQSLFRRVEILAWSWHWKTLEMGGCAWWGCGEPQGKETIANEGGPPVAMSGCRPA